MQKHIILAMAALSLLAPPLAFAGGEEDGYEEKTVIALKTDDFELSETDISHLEVGDGETIVTESGKTIDLLRTQDGIEIYVDGELVEPSMHGDHKLIHKRVEVVCEEEDSCEELVWISEDRDIDLEVLHGEGHELIMLHGDDAEELVELQSGEQQKKIFIIRESSDSE
jgi:hypothetical protein